MNDEAHLSAEQSGSEAPSRFPRSHGDPRWPQRAARPSRPWPQEPERLNDAPPTRAPAVIGRRADFLAANRGRRAPMPGFVLLVRERGDGDPAMRIGITVTKKIGGAVVRNRMKRRFRVLARELLPIHGVAGADHVLIGRNDGVERDFSLLRSELEKALRKVMSRPAGEYRGPARKKTASATGKGEAPVQRKSGGTSDRRKSGSEDADDRSGGGGSTLSQARPERGAGPKPSQVWSEHGAGSKPSQARPEHGAGSKPPHLQSEHGAGSTLSQARSEHGAGSTPSHAQSERGAESTPSQEQPKRGDETDERDRGAS